MSSILRLFSSMLILRFPPYSSFNKSMFEAIRFSLEHEDFAWHLVERKSSIATGQTTECDRVRVLASS